jgi:hypothetical protein
MIAIIDSDSLTYAVGFSSNDIDEALAVSRLEATMIELCMEVECDEYEGYLTGTGNFRYELAKTAPYKGNRISEKPIHLQALRNHLVESWGFVIVDGIEADDIVATRGTELKDECIIVGIDKDLLQIPGWHYNYRKHTKQYVDEFTGWYNFYLQILTGDVADNIKGLKGIGPAKGAKILKDCTNVEELYEAVLKAYDGDTPRVLENGNLLYLQRKQGDVWQPPLK